MAKCEHTELWKARDGRWRCVACVPPRFAGEVVARAGHAQLRLDELAEEREERDRLYRPWRRDRVA